MSDLPAIETCVMLGISHKASLSTDQCIGSMLMVIPGQCEYAPINIICRTEGGSFAHTVNYRDAADSLSPLGLEYCIAVLRRWSLPLERSIIFSDRIGSSRNPQRSLDAAL